ncbi:MAG: thiamine pyrophosphate-dependent enzyme [Candidatus Bathyarchaeia archaeon]
MAMTDALKTPTKNTWCPGCGNFGILTALKRALVKLKLDPSRTVIVTGIGCHGKMADYVRTNSFYGIHGRVLPAATGIKLANHDLKVIGFAGDGDAYAIGFGHFAHAARRNIDITYIVHNNMVFGLTTGQTAPTSQRGYRSKTHPQGVPELPLNPVAEALASNASLVARAFSGDMPYLTEIMVQGIQHRGFAFIDVFQPCVTFNRVNTYDFFRQRVYKLEDVGHDPTDKVEAWRKAQEWGEKIPIGVFYKETRPVYSEGIPAIGTEPLIKSPLVAAEKIDGMIRSLT